MNKLLSAAALTLLGLSLAGTAAAQTVQYKTEVCVNASQAAEAKRRFPKASLHVIPDDPDPGRNGIRVVIRGGDKNMSNAEEIRLRAQQRNQDFSE